MKISPQGVTAIFSSFGSQTVRRKKGAHCNSDFFQFRRHNKQFRHPGDENSFYIPSHVLPSLCLAINYSRLCLFISHNYCAVFPSNSFSLSRSCQLQGIFLHHCLQLKTVFEVDTHHAYLRQKPELKEDIFYYHSHDDETKQ